MARQPRTPKLCHHKGKDLAYVTLNGVEKYLGAWGSPDSLANYDRVMAEWHARGRTDPAAPDHGTAGLTVAELINAFRLHAAEYYRKPDGTPTAEVEAFRWALRPLRKLYSALPAADFSPLKLEAVRTAMIAGGWSRKTINRQVGRIKQLFSWGVAKELVPGNVAYSIREVKGLKRGRGGKERPRIKPVEDAAIDPVFPLVSLEIAAMIRLQLLTGMRPAEACAMSPTDLDTSKEPWIYTPAEHKTQHHEIERFIYLGPKAQEIIRPFLTTDLQACLFTPSAAEARRNEQRRENRQTPMTPSQRLRKPKKNPERAKGDRYSVATYRRAIARACDIAFPPPAPLARQDRETSRQWKARLTVDQRRELRQWYALHRWHPHQLRHSAATRFRREFGVDAAGVLLGHNTLAITGVYAEQDQAKAMRIMAKVG